MVLSIGFSFLQYMVLPSFCDHPVGSRGFLEFLFRQRGSVRLGLGFQGGGSGCYGGAAAGAGAATGAGAAAGAGASAGEDAQAASKLTPAASNTVPINFFNAIRFTLLTHALEARRTAPLVGNAKCTKARATYRHRITSVYRQSDVRVCLAPHLLVVEGRA